MKILKCMRIFDWYPVNFRRSQTLQTMYAHRGHPGQPLSKVWQRWLNQWCHSVIPGWAQLSAWHNFAHRGQKKMTPSHLRRLISLTSSRKQAVWVVSSSVCCIWIHFWWLQAVIFLGSVVLFPWMFLFSSWLFCFWHWAPVSSQG